MGDVFRRTVARTMSQQLATPFESATAPFQYAPSSRAGTECVNRAVRLTFVADPRATLLSIDGVGAFDHIGREGIFRGLMNQGQLANAVPYVRLSVGKTLNTHATMQREGLTQYGKPKVASKATRSYHSCSP